MKRNSVITTLFILSNLLFAQKEELHLITTRFPADKAEGVNPDTHLVITFPSEPTLGKSGQIRIYDAADNRLVDLLDLSIPPRSNNRQQNVGTLYSDSLRIYLRPLYQCQY